MSQGFKSEAHQYLLLFCRLRNSAFLLAEKICLSMQILTSLLVAGMAWLDQMGKIPCSRGLCFQYESNNDVWFRVRDKKQRR